MNIDNVLYAHKILGSGRKTKPSGVIIGVPNSVYYGDTINISWGASSDSSVIYYLDVQLDNGVWSNIYTGSAISTSYTIPNIAYSNCKFRVSCCKLGLNFSIFGYSNIVSLSKKPVPGPVSIIAGDTNSGYYGEVKGLCTGEQFRTLTNTNDLVSNGQERCKLTADNEDIRFFKLIFNNKILFIPDIPIIRDISQQTLNSKGLSNGSLIINLNGYKFKVRQFDLGNAKVIHSYGHDGKIFDSINEYEDCYFKYIPEDSYTKQATAKTSFINFLASRTSITNWNLSYDATLVTGVNGNSNNNNTIADCYNYISFLKYESHPILSTCYTYEDGRDKTHYNPFLWRPVLEFV